MERDIYVITDRLVKTSLCLPTETLLRLHLPLSDKVRTGSRGEFPIKEANYNPEASPERSIGRCDGRCVL